MKVLGPIVTYRALGASLVDIRGNGYTILAVGNRAAPRHDRRRSGPLASVLGVPGVRRQARSGTTFAADSPVTIACSRRAHASSAWRVSRRRLARSYTA